MHPVLILSEIDVQSRIKTNIPFFYFHNSKYDDEKKTVLTKA